MECKLCLLTINFCSSIRSMQNYSMNFLEIRGPEDVFMDFSPRPAPHYNGTTICIVLSGPSKNS